jgi:membrane protein
LICSGASASAIVANIVPAGVLDLLSGEISRMAAKSDNKLTFGFLIGLAVALWSANAGMKAIFDALNIRAGKLFPSVDPRNSAASLSIIDLWRC